MNCNNCGIGLADGESTCGFCRKNNQAPPPIRLNPVDTYWAIQWPETKAFLARLGVPMLRDVKLVITFEKEKGVTIQQTYHGVDAR